VNDWKHFLLSSVAFVGGGWLLIHEPTTAEWVKTTLTGVIAFWFGAKVQNGNGNGNGHKSA
jgi:hypothetical protein